jgi:hypothetical protein
MTKKSLLTLFFIGAAIFINAQDITFGIKGGVNFATIGKIYHYGPNGGNNVTPTEDAYYSAGGVQGKNFGAYFRLNIKYFYIQPEVNFSNFTGSYQFALKESEWTQSNVNLGLLFGYRLFGPLAIYMGPVLSIINDRQLEGTESTSFASWQYEKSNMSVSFGLAASWDRISIDARYVYGLSAAENQKIDMVRAKYGTNLGETLEYNPSQFILSLQVDLFNFGGEKNKRRAKSDWRNHTNL